jgi:hypothetical protein
VTSFARKCGLQAEEIDGDTVVFDVGASRLHVLNAPAAAVFELCSGPISVDALVDAVTSTFGVARSIAHRDVVAVLDRLREEGLLVDVTDER